MTVANIFHGSGTDIYIHWLILALGIGVLLSAMAVLTSCRSIAFAFNLLNQDNSLRTRIYRGFYRLHSTYWIAFGCFLALHLMVAITHLSLPEPGEPYHVAHEVVFWTATTNGVLLAGVLCSCRTIASAIEAVMSKSPLTNSAYNRFYRYHSYFWWPFGVSLGIHIIFGMIHALNT
jgi:hypothetical protein